MKDALTDGRRQIDGRSVRWDSARAQAAYAAGHWTDSTLADALAETAQRTPDRVVLVDGEEKLDASTLADRASRLASYLLAHFPTGSVVSFMLPNWHEAAAIYLGATLAGMVANPVLPSLRQRDLQFLLGDVDSRIVFIPSQFRGHDYSAMLANVVASLDNPPRVVVVRGGSDPGEHLAYESLLDTTPPDTLPQLNPDAVRMIMYTSGTTGRPKGVMHSHNSLHALIRQIGKHWHVAPGSRFLVASPISHIGGSIYAFECPLLLQSTAILMEQWDADTAVRCIDDLQCTHFAGATPFLVQTLAAARRSATHLNSLRIFICGGASVPPSLIRDAEAYFDSAVVTRVYGSTEVPVTTVGSTASGDVDHAAETDGKAGIARIRFSNEGEILVRGPQMLVGYHHREDEQSAFDSEGFYRSGDQGKWIEEQYLVVTGRIKDLIIRNGENIAPKEVEDLLLEHPDIANVAIVGLPDTRTGERACAVIVIANDHAPDLAEVQDFLNARGIAKFKLPEQVEIWPQLPTNAAGKVLKSDIKARLVEGTA